MPNSDDLMSSSSNVSPQGQNSPPPFSSDVNLGDVSLPPPASGPSASELQSSPTPTAPVVSTNVTSNQVLKGSKGRRRKMFVATILGFLLILGGAIAGILLTQQPQVTEEKAACENSPILHCTSSSISSSNLEPGGQIKVTITADRSDVKHFWIAFYNLDNLYSADNPKPIDFGIADEVVDEDGSNCKGISNLGSENHFEKHFCTNKGKASHTFVIKYDDVNKADKNFGNKKPKNIQVNGFFSLMDGTNWTCSDSRCVQKFSAKTLAGFPPETYYGTCVLPDSDYDGKSDSYNPGNQGCNADYAEKNGYANCKVSYWRCLLDDNIYAADGSIIGEGDPNNILKACTSSHPGFKPPPETNLRSAVFRAQSESCGIEQIDMHCDGKLVGWAYKAYGKDCLTATPTPTPTLAPTPTPTPTVMPTATPTAPPQVSGQCVSIQAYSANWKKISLGDLSNLSAGEKVYFSVKGTVTSGVIDKARFSVTSSASAPVSWRTPVTSKVPGTKDEFYDTYTIPEGQTSFVIRAQLHYADKDFWF